MGSKSRFYVDIMDLHDGVTGSCHLCVAKFPNDEKVNFLVDCGLFQGEDSEELNASFTFKPENISFCLITHNHVDHIGRLPLLVKNYFSGEIYATESTTKLMGNALFDSCSVLKSKNFSHELYNEDDVRKALEACVPCRYEEAVCVHPNIKAFFFRNAHLPGAASILLQVTYEDEEPINILFTGDYNEKNEFLYDSYIPDWVLELPLTIVCESTYGYTDSTEVVPCFDENLLKAVEDKKTTIALVFSLGRTQEILHRLKCLQDAGKLDPNIPIYLDGKLAIKYTDMYSKGELDIKPEMIDFFPQNVVIVDKIIRKSLLYEDNSCKIIVTSSGMGSYGPARSYIPAFLGRKDALIHFTGYTAEGTMGRRIKDTPKGEEVQTAGFLVIKQADVEYTSEFSAHAKADQLIDFLRKFKNIKLILINHGEPENKKIFAKRILKEMDVKQVGILNREMLFRIDTWGIVKTIPTKFI